MSPNKDVVFPTTNYKFKSDEYPFRTDGGRDQEVVYNEALALLKKYRSALLSLFCGHGKTFAAIRIAQTVGLKAAVLTHRAKLTDQWVESIQKFTTAKAQVVDTAGILDPTADFYIFNIAMVPKQWDKSTNTWKLKKLNCFSSIGFVIVDEGHIIGAKKSQ